MGVLSDGEAEQVAMTRDWIASGIAAKQVSKAEIDSVLRDLAIIDRLVNLCESLQNRGDLHLVFDSMPSPEACNFIEAEDAYGHSVSCGEWISRDDGWCALVVKNAMPQPTGRGS